MALSLEPAFDKDILRFRFAVLFLAGGIIPNPLDIRFQKVSGLKVSVNTQANASGGENTHHNPLPEGLTYSNLILERGMVIGSPLNTQLSATFASFRFSPANIIITLFNDCRIPIPVAGWFFYNAYPVSWATSDLDASAKDWAIDTLELTYSRMWPLRI